MNIEIINLLEKHLQWDIKEVTSLQSIGGLNNNNFKLLYNSKSYFMRICSNNLLVLDRSNEFNILKKASQINLCPSPLYFDKVNGHMVTPWIYGTMPTESQSNSKYIISKLITKLKTFHRLKCNAIFNPFNEIRKRVSLCRKHNIPLPYFIDITIKKLSILECELCKSQLIGLCHNDLNPSNILLTEDDLYLIDYEMSGMGDIFFDLATVAWLVNEDTRKTILKEYFGYFDPKDYNKLIKYLYVVKMLNGTWSLLKSLDTTNNYDYTTGANLIFNELLDFKL